ncbi:MAG: hypothetical protein ACW98F_11320, partial [Candidatus Hodarchaeales archaeon]
QIGLVHIRGESDNHGDIRIENNHITEIIMSNDSLTEIPDCINNLTELKGVNLENNYLISLPESLTQLTKLEYLCLTQNNFISLSESLSRWFIEREEAGCVFTGISTKRIKTLWEIPPEEKEFILELEKFENKLLPLWQEDPMDSGDGSTVSFFSAEGGHITILRIKDESCEGNSTGISELLSYIGNLKNLKELTIGGYKSEWPTIQNIIEKEFPDRFKGSSGNYEPGSFPTEIGFFPKDGLEGLDFIFGLRFTGRSPDKYSGRFH